MKASRSYYLNLMVTFFCLHPVKAISWQLLWKSFHISNTLMQKVFLPDVKEMVHGELPILNEKMLLDLSTKSIFHLSCSEDTVTSISKSRKNVISVIQSFIKRSQIDVNIRMLLCNCLYSLRRSNEAHKPD